jgi:competence protein ComEA
MLAPQERRLLLLLALWLALGAALDAVSLSRPRLIVPLVGEERFADLLRSGREAAGPGGADPGPAGAAADSAGPASPGRSPRRGAAAPRRGRALAYDALGRLDLNLADSTELDLVDGIGPALASRILAERARRGGFRRVEDLLAVRGIGPRTLGKLLPHLGVRPPAGADSGRAGGSARP